ncbi:MAG: hypothetical protein DWP98_01395 [Bacteroidetes bacterium]|nr:MAG: hypothetical protein DWP98_01395 [Bacteroidota bacterium]MBL1144434.1 hypothetical protein [Bacteroidota bacterium]MCB0802139.1 hypothetical protein [Flavobacteriales bacterium]NOG57228.1 hypothetical protein [Bacteroidota bacterium]
MIVSDFSDTCKLYDGFHIWEIESLDAFFRGSDILATIFHDFYHIPFEELNEKRNEIADSDFDIMINLLTLVNDKSFFLFTLHDENHLELVGMQKRKIMNFGMDIERIRKDRVYAMIMDKAK